MSWIKTNDYYNRDVVKCDIYSKKVSKSRTIYLQDSKENNFMFSFSCGANSDFSFSGGFYKTNISNVQEAMEYLDKFAPLWFSVNYKGMKELADTIKN